MLYFQSFGWGVTLHLESIRATTTILWPEGLAVAGPHPRSVGLPNGIPDYLVPPADRGQAWYFQHPGPYVNAGDALCKLLRMAAIRWETYGLTAKQAEYLRDSCDPDPWEDAIERGICSAREVYCPPETIGSMPYWEAIAPRRHAGWHPLLPLVGAPRDEFVTY